MWKSDGPNDFNASPMGKVIIDFMTFDIFYFASFLWINKEYNIIIIFLFVRVRRHVGGQTPGSYAHDSPS